MKQQQAYAAAAAAAKVLTVSAVALAIAGCSLFSSDKRKPVELEPNVALLSVQQAWTQRIGKSNPTLVMNVSGNVVTLASADGQIAAVNADTGADLWRLNLGQKLSAGVGSDGKWAAVVTEDGNLVAINQGKEMWRKRLPARVYTAPLVAGQRIFVQSADRSVQAFDAASGQALWNQAKTSESLVLRQSGVLTAYQDTLIAGVSGRFVGIDPNTGALRWEVPIASPRGTNDVERLVELVGGVSRQGSVLCTRAYQMAVGCIDAATAQLSWTVRAEGINGISGDADVVAGADGNGVITAWAQNGGSVVWTSNRLRYRKLSQPLVLGRSVIFGDSSGTVHMLSKKDGSPLNRFSTNSSGISVAPVLAGNTMVVQTNDGAVYGFRPE
ncbi:outer membrane assembly lipoprotein YfgL [Comamonas sp. BIGb0152]|uniref:outer membrane protein assembly factor BamB n=1 Tax=Comamonas sp. BIGb0152 TaxID=2940601 RepID=UPI00216AB256|nr:outer membrane protein assembly factor BamB [Comamonas sp. BIGb0152]MCS4295919.1 outer membrane assembly lipoprotein YfgL [Comamonas sp. BIGb0152]